MIKGYREEVLKNLGVYELRELARRIGVSSPTTKKRKQLEQEILKISKGEIVPEEKRTNKGRPPKSIKKVESVLDVFIPKELLELTLNKKVDNEIGQILNFSANCEMDHESYDVSGFVKKTISGYFYFKIGQDGEKCVSIPNEIAVQYSLCEGDKIVGKAKKLQQDNYYTFSYLELINNHEPKENRVLGDDKQIVLKNLPIKHFEGVNEGDNILFINESLRDGIAKIKELINPLSKDYAIVAFAPNVSVYTKLLVEKDFGGEVLYSLLEDHPALVYEVAENACNHVDMLLKEGKKVIFVMFDIFGLLNGIETFFALENQRQSYQERIEAIRIVKKMFNYGKVLENNASVTVLATCLLHETEDKFYKNDLIKSADKILKI